MDKLSTLRESYAEMARLCYCLDSMVLMTAVGAIEDEMNMLADDDLERALELITETLTHVNDLDEELFEQHADTILDINELADQIREDANCI